MAQSLFPWCGDRGLLASVATPDSLVTFCGPHPSSGRGDFVNSFPAFAHQPVAFTQPGTGLLAESCTLPKSTAKTSRERGHKNCPANSISFLQDLLKQVLLVVELARERQEAILAKLQSGDVFFSSFVVAIVARSLHMNGGSNSLWRCFTTLLARHKFSRGWDVNTAFTSLASEE